MRHARCLALLVLLTFFLSTPVALAQQGDELMRLIGPIRGPEPVQTDGRVSIFDQTGVKTSHDRFRYSRFDWGMTWPLLETEDRRWTMGLDFKMLDLDTDARLPRSPTDAFPRELYDVGATLSFRRQLENGWLMGVTGRLGSASDKPFNSGDEVDVNITGFWRIPHRRKNAWLLFLNYANHRAGSSLEHVPLPGVAYQFSFRERDWAMVGLPVSALHMQLLERLELDLSYAMIRNARAKLTWKALDELDVYGQFVWGSQGFWRAARPDEDDALLFYEKKLSLGTDWSPWENLKVGLEAGLAFDRFIFEGNDYNDNDDNRIGLTKSLFGGVSVRLAF